MSELSPHERAKLLEAAMHPRPYSTRETSDADMAIVGARGCNVCGADEEGLVVGYLKSGKLTARCLKHASPIRELVAVSAFERSNDLTELRERAGVPFTGPTLVHARKPGEPDDDRKWFAAHPTRSHRLRLIGPQDAKDFGSNYAAYGTHVIIRQAKPGARFRFAVHLDQDPSDGTAVVMMARPDGIVEVATPPVPADDDPEQEAFVHQLTDLLLGNKLHDAQPPEAAQ